MKCDNCGAMSIAVQPLALASDYVAARRHIDDPDATPRWLPERVYGKEFPDVPEQIAAAASEAWVCYSIGQYRASAAMARAVVEATAKDKGITTGGILAKIDALYDQEIIGKGVKEAAHEIRFLGNDMAHGDFVASVPEELIADMLGFLDQFLDEAYQRDAKLTRFREQRLALRGE
ncbi:uncharacterized protein DUF4145 [Salana multivorans]|uniref:Uncharacterized protein DUF4145 n=2 Tax=Salana multivorans TaxID=120377 RepID=A0A3N2DDD3_9MICO|nr:uncharacterized protein DUF4145 [Salana multivorans]